MSRRSLLVISSAAALALSACADVYDYGPPTPYYYDGFYDNYYGAVQGGYWGPDQVFYFRTGRSGTYRRDDARHFRREGGNGLQPFHLRDPKDHERRERPRPPAPQHPLDQEHRGPSPPHP